MFFKEVIWCNHNTFITLDNDLMFKMIFFSKKKYKKYNILKILFHLPFVVVVTVLSFLVIKFTNSCSRFFKNSNRSFKFLFITLIYFYYIDIDIVCLIFFFILVSFKSKISSSSYEILFRIILFYAIKLLFMYYWLIFFLPLEFFMKSCYKLSSFIWRALLSFETIRKFFYAISRAFLN